MKYIKKITSEILNLSKKAYFYFSKIIFNKLTKSFVSKLIRNPEKIIVFAFEEFSPISEQLIETSLCCTFNALTPTPERIISNYLQGAVLFGVHNKNCLHWKIPHERSIITAETAHLPRKKRILLKKSAYNVRYNSNFDEVIKKSCRRDVGSWITEPLIPLYKSLFEAGFVWCIEAYDRDVLVAGAWGIIVGGVCAGMSTFHSVDQAGSFLTCILVEKIINGEIPVLDCGNHKPHFSQFGATVISRERFVEKVVQYINHPPISFETFDRQIYVN